jgi:PKD repeat protein
MFLMAGGLPVAAIAQQAQVESAQVNILPGKKSLLIMLDGLRSDGVINAISPNMDSLIDGTFGGGGYQGGYGYFAQTIQDAPTSSAYNHVSIMTGVGATKHGVSSNSAAAIAAVDYGLWPTYLSTLESIDPSVNTVFLATWSADLSMTTGADYDKQSSDAGNVVNLVNILNGSYSDPSGNNGTSWSLGTDVDAIALYLDDIDGAGHGFGFSPDVPGYIAEIEEIDSQIGQLLTAIENRPGFTTEDWQIVITTDHGGIGTGHGGLNPNSETIPFIVASKSTSQGLLSGGVINYDAAATVIAHMMGDAAVPAHYDGMTQGDFIITPPPAVLTDDMVVYLPFNGNTLDASGQGNNAFIGAGSDHDPTVHANGGKFGGYVEINDLGGGSSDASYLTLDTPADLELGTDINFSVTTWFRAQSDQSGDPVILGNKNWVSGLNSGVLLLANESNGDDFGFNISDGSLRRDIEPIDYSLNEWWFQAVTVDRTGNAVMFVGSPNGLLYVISDFALDLGDITSVLPWNIGQDGTGSYPHNLDGDIDEMAIWRRALVLDEIRQLYNNGNGINLQATFNQAPNASFGYVCVSLDCSFIDSSSDSDGTVVSRAWDFGDLNSSSSQNPAHSYASAGTYTVMLTVTDNDGAAADTSSQVTVTAPSGNTPPTADAGGDNGSYAVRLPKGRNATASVTLDGSGSFDPDGDALSFSWDGGTWTTPQVTVNGLTRGKHEFVLEVDDGFGGSDTAIACVEVHKGKTAGGLCPTNTGPTPPVASFNYTCSDLACDFTDTSSPTDGDPITSWSWNFGDGSGSNVANPSHTFGADGTYTIDLFVADKDGTDASSRQVTVSVGGSDIMLSTSGRKRKGVKIIDLTWSGATGGSVEVYRDNVLIETTPNDDFFTDTTGEKGGGNYTSKVCETGGSACSNEVVTTF